MVERLKKHAEGLDEEGLDEVVIRNLENAKTMAEQELEALEEVLETVWDILMFDPAPLIKTNLVTYPHFHLQRKLVDVYKAKDFSPVCVHSLSAG